MLFFAASMLLLHLTSHIQGHLIAHLDKDGPLGLAFKKGVTPLTIKKVNEGSMLAVSQRRLRPGLQLVAIGTELTENMDYDVAITKLKEGPRPLELRFAHPTIDDAPARMARAEQLAQSGRLDRALKIASFLLERERDGLQELDRYELYVLNVNILTALERHSAAIPLLNEIMMGGQSNMLLVWSQTLVQALCATQAAILTSCHMQYDILNMLPHGGQDHAMPRRAYP